MERRSWLWRRRSSGKSHGEAESSGSLSLSSNSERCSDDQEALRASPIDVSPDHLQSPDVSSNSNIVNCEVQETVKSLNEKLSAALLNIKAKEDLVKQHAKVAEEAVSGWEMSETEVAVLKQQLEAAAQKNSALVDRISHLDGALKECVRQLRQSRVEQEQKVCDALIKKTHEWESDKSELERRLIELHTQLEAKKAVAATSIDLDLRLMLESLEKENFALKVELLARSDDLQKQMLERELSTRAAETASKQHLESKKKVARLEAECHRLNTAARKLTAINGHKSLANSVCLDFFTECQSDSGERLLGMDSERNSDSWASPLIPELDQFMNEKALTRNLTAASIEIDLMDDFLEMERLASLPEADRGSSNFELHADFDRAVTDKPLKAELDAVRRKMAELEEKAGKMTNEKVEMNMALAETQNQLNISCGRLIVAEDKLLELQRKLNSANAAKHIFEVEVEAVEAKRKELEYQLDSTNSEVGNLRVRVGFLEGKVEEEKARHAEFADKCLNLEATEAKRKDSESLVESANLEVKKLHDKVGLLEKKVEEERALSAECAAKCRSMKASETNSKELESQLKSAYVEIEELRAKVSFLEGKAEEEAAYSAGFASEVEIVEAERRELKSQLELAHSEAGKLCDKIVLLERAVEEARASSAEFAAKCQDLEAAEAKRIELESQLNSAQLEVTELRVKLGSLEMKANEERASKLDAEHRRPTGLNGELNIRQEKGLAVAAGKLTECQKTIAALGRQLKSLATFEDFVLEDEKPEPDEASLDHTGGAIVVLHSSDHSEDLGGSFTPTNGEERESPLSSLSSSPTGFGTLLCSR